MFSDINSIRMKRIVILSMSLLLYLSAAYAQAQTPKSSPVTFKKGVCITHWADFLFEGRTYGDPEWFGEKDMRWIKEQGFDHILIYLDGTEIAHEKGDLRPARIEVLDTTISLARKYNLGTILSIQKYPPIPEDSLRSEQEQAKLTTEMNNKFWKSLETSLKHHGNNLRYNIAGEPRLLTASHIQYYKTIVPSIYKIIRSENTTRHLYITNYSFGLTDSLTLEPGMKNISIAFKLGSHQLFSAQHGKPFWFPENLPPISFPDTLPDLTAYLAENSPFVQLSEKVMDKSLIESDIKRVTRNIERNNYKTVEKYLLDWGYYTGYPYDPTTTRDSLSIKNFAHAMASVIDTSHLSFSIYDYNSGMAVNLNDAPSFLLRYLDLKKKKRGENN